MEEVSVYDIKDHAYGKFRLGHAFVCMESAQVCLTASCYSAPGKGVEYRDEHGVCGMCVCLVHEH